MIITLVLWTYVALTVLGSLLLVSKIGQPREPITPAMAVYILLFNGFWVTVLVLELLR